MKKLMLSNELITHMENRGISFNIMNKEDALNFLTHNNYYMKLASYRSNYDKYTSGSNTGKYINLEFAYLVELSTIDMHLRKLVLQMALDIEHFLKVNLLQRIESNPNEDGYNIIQKFIAKDDNLSTLKKIQKHKSSDYCKGLIEKYYPYFPAWVFVELISFGELAYLCEFYKQTYKDEIADNILLNSVRDIRNASAHSNCLINVLRPGNNTPHHSVINRVKNISSIKQNARDKKLSNKCIYDFVCLIFAYDLIISSESVKKSRYEELQKFLDERVIRNKNWFSNNNLLTSSYSFIKKVVDYTIQI